MSRPDIIISLPRIPNWGLVGSNRSHAHWGQVARAKRAEKDAWIALFLASDARPRQEPLLRGDVQAEIEVQLPNLAHWPDEQNVLEGYKVFIDLLEPQRVERTLKDGWVNWRQLGYLGLIENDARLRWTAPPNLALAPDGRPRTVLTLYGEGAAETWVIAPDALDWPSIPAVAVPRAGSS